MIKFKAGREWYESAASQEEQVDFLSSGRLFFQNSKSKDEKKIIRGEAFSAMLRMLRLDSKLSFEQLAKKIKVNPNELRMLERSIGYMAEPKILILLAKFYKIPTQKFLQVGNFHEDVDSQFEEEITQFASESESFDQLTDGEKKLLKKIIKVLEKN